MLEWLQTLHTPEGISRIIETGGMIAMIVIIFVETGLLVGLFLPGDSLLITAGVLANAANPHHIASLNILVMNIALAVAAITGDQLGFYLGRKTGGAIWNRPDGRFYKKKHLEAAHAFYLKYGGISVVAARYIPIFRTFVPFAAGMALMPYRKFVLWNVLGGILWITSLLWIGYFLGQTPLANRLDKIILLVIFVSTLPVIFSAIKGYLSSRKKNSESQAMVL